MQNLSKAACSDEEREAFKKLQRPENMKKAYARTNADVTPAPTTAQPLRKNLTAREIYKQLGEQIRDALAAQPAGNEHDPDAATRAIRKAQTQPGDLAKLA